jgi:hypothetical protein
MKGLSHLNYHRNTLLSQVREDTPMGKDPNITTYFKLLLPSSQSHLSACPTLIELTLNDSAVIIQSRGGWVGLEQLSFSQSKDII